MSYWLKRSGLLVLSLCLICSLNCSSKKDDPTATTKDNVLVKAAHMSDEKITISQLRTVHRAQEQYRGEANRYGSMAELVEKGVLTRDPSGHNSYKYTITANGDTYQCVAVPQVYGTSGRYSFYIDDKGEVYGADHKGGPASPADEKIVN